MTTVAVDAFLIYAVLGFHFPTGRNSQYSVRVFLQHHGHCKVYLNKFKCNANYHKGDSCDKKKKVGGDSRFSPSR